MANTKYPYRLLTPGPVPLPPEVLTALAQPMRHHRTPEFIAVLERVKKGLQWFFGTEQPVLPLTSTGSGAMEAALVNTCAKGDEVLCIVSGKFGERWADMASRFGLQVHRHDVAWGEALDLAAVEKRLSPRLKAVLVQAVETSTATMNPIQELAGLVQAKSSALVLVDAITGLGAMELPMDRWGLDVVVGGSQKAFMLPTGLAFVALSARAWVAQSRADLPKYYFDLAQEQSALAKGQTFFSSANAHLVALDVVLTGFQERGLPWLRQRCELLAEATRAGAQKLGLEIFSRRPSPSVTAVRVPAGINGATLRDHLEREYNVIVMGGQDQLLGKILRFGHLGYITNADAVAGVELLGQSLIDLRHPGLTSFALQEVRRTMEHILARGPDVR